MVQPDEVQYKYGIESVPGKYYTICNSLDAACLAGKITQVENDHASEYIMEQLGGYAWVQGWLWVHVPEFQKLQGKVMHIEVQAYRHRWVDALIEGLSK